jgi:type IV pilus modification protein PilV
MSKGPFPRRMDTLHNRLAHARREAGFTIIEVLVAMFLLAVGVLGVATMADSANLVSDTAKARVGATNLAREVLEDARAFDYAELTGTVPAGGSSTTLQSDIVKIGLNDADASTAGWQIKRRGITYNMSVFTCVLDDVHDGARAAVPLGGTDVNAAGPYCAGSTDPATGNQRVDKNPDDYRKVEVSVTWTVNGRAPNCAGAAGTITSPATAGLGRACVTQTELIPNPSGGLGPAVKSVVRAGPSNGPVEGDVDHVDMTATTASPAGSVTWTADDGATGTATQADTNGTVWNFTWPLSATDRDGPHTVTAQAFLLTAGGVPKDGPVSLNRFIPGVPARDGGGLDTRQGTSNPAAAISWLQIQANDLIGYTVYRARIGNTSPVLTGPNADTPVCSTTSVSSTFCMDTSNNLGGFADSSAVCPANSNPGDACIDYYVVPFDQEWTTLPDPPTYQSTDYCSGSPWGAITPPTPPVSAISSVPPLTTTSSWSSARAGCPSDFIAVDYTQDILNPPPALLKAGTPQCSTTSDGLAIINWVAAPATDNVVAYRVYRDPQGNNPPAYNDPATTINSATAASFTDPSPTLGAPHDYYVTAVDDHFNESSPLLIPWSPGACP